MRISLWLASLKDRLNQSFRMNDITIRTNLLNIVNQTSINRIFIVLKIIKNTIQLFLKVTTKQVGLKYFYTFDYP